MPEAVNPGTPVRLVRFVVRAASRNGQPKGAMFTLREDNPHVAQYQKDTGYEWSFTGKYASDTAAPRKPKTTPTVIVKLDGAWGDLTRSLSTLAERSDKFTPDERQAWADLLEARFTDQLAPLLERVFCRDVEPTERRPRLTPLEDPTDAGGESEAGGDTSPPADPPAADPVVDEPAGADPLTALLELAEAIDDHLNLSDRKLLGLAAAAGITVPKAKRTRPELIKTLGELRDERRQAIRDEQDAELAAKADAELKAAAEAAQAKAAPPVVADTTVVAAPTEPTPAATPSTDPTPQE